MTLPQEPRPPEVSLSIVSHGHGGMVAQLLGDLRALGWPPDAYEVLLTFNTPEDGRARKDSAAIRRTAVGQNIPYYLTVDGAQAAIGAIEALLKGEQGVRSLQEYHTDA